MIKKTPDFYSAHDSRCLALCGMATYENNKEGIEDSRKSFRTARKITKNEGIVNETLFLFTEMIKKDDNEILSGLKLSAYT